MSKQVANFLEAQPVAVQERIDMVLTVLSAEGPSLGRPLADSIAGSRSIKIAATIIPIWYASNIIRGYAASRRRQNNFACIAAPSRGYACISATDG
jgi:hypothetical protein